MNSDNLSEALKSILEDSEEDTRFWLMAKALRQKKFLFFKTFYNPAWKLAPKRLFADDFLTAMLFLIMYTYHCDFNTVQFLCDNYEVDLNHVDMVVGSLFDVALEHYGVEVASYLVKHGADPLLKTNLTRGRYAYIMSHDTPDVIQKCDYMYSLGVPIEWRDMTYVVESVADNSGELIAWLYTHGHPDAYAGTLPLLGEEEMLGNIIVRAFNHELFREIAWLEKIETLLKLGVNPHEEMAFDFMGETKTSMQYVKDNLQIQPNLARKILELMRAYSD